MIVGPMYAAKSHMLINEYNKYNAKFDDFSSTVLVVKPKIDTRNKGVVHSRSAGEILAYSIENFSDIKNLLTNKTKYIFVDEFNFFDSDMVKVMKELNSKGVSIIVSGLNLDFKRIPFDRFNELKEIATCVTLTTAVCYTCGKIALYSRREQKDASNEKNDSQIAIENDDVKYYSSCLKCHKI